MDKKLKRVIGYTGAKSVVPQKKETIAIDEHKVENIDISSLIAAELAKAKKITDWINSHPEFKWGVMCNKIGIDKGNFQRTLKSGEPKIKIEFIAKIEDFLKKYGYAK